ncbi:alcohol dehydrogenase IV [Auriscalpium vulgare]|uniref:Alcohol dehydrogenase IV n=1 Tax=Auriscalpium vulgare TaxID=40419 RepID=A0ACB8S505_9AGAM|nr:alcohol dehydrogenase IV [Auriscalpium vulgare]
MSSESTKISGSYAYSETLSGVHYGPGSVKTALPTLLKQIGGKKALVVTGKSLFNKTDVVKTVESILRAENAFGATFYDIGEHSPIAGIRAGVQAFKDAGADIIVSVGGGSPIDASKAIIFHLKQEKPESPTYRQIAIPTTLSAAEYTIGAGYTNEVGQKVALTAPDLGPTGIILDAELTLPTPERLWLSTGIRALDHAVETLYRPHVVPPVKALAYQAIRDLFEYLPKSKANAQDVLVRQSLQLASWMSMWPFKSVSYSPLGLSHALGHRLGASYGIPHGITSCLTLASVVRLKSNIASEEDKKALSTALIYLQQPSTGSIEGDAAKLGDLIEDLVTRLGLKSNLSDLAVPREHLPKIAELALGGQTEIHGNVVKLLETLY